MDERTIEGWVELPAGEPGAPRGDAVVELRDVTQLDAPSRLVASVRLADVVLAPGLRLPFQLRAPSALAATALNLRVQLQATGPAAAATGPTPVFLTTQAYPVPPDGNVSGLTVLLEKVAG